MEDYYSILGVSNNATEDEIKKAFRKLSVKWHPDKWVNATDDEKKTAEDKFKSIAEAYNTLSDPQKRQAYDSRSSSGFSGMGGADDLMEAMRRMREHMGFGFGPRHVRRDTGDLMVYCSVSLSEIFSRSPKKFKYTRNIPCSHCWGTGAEGPDGIEVCPHCHGTGSFVRTERRGYTTYSEVTQCPHCGGVGKTIKKKCSVCGGTGYEKIQEEVDIPMANGVTDNVCLTIEGGGNIAENGMPPGDLNVVFTVTGSNGFTLANGYDMQYNADVDVFDCITGTDYKIKTLDNRTLKIKIKQGTRHGDTMRIRGEGIWKQDGSRGDLFLKVNQKMPKEITKNAIKKIGELKKIIK